MNVWPRLAVLGLALTLGGPLVSGAQNSPAGSVLKKEVPPRPHELCLVCNNPIGASDKVNLVEGQRVAVHHGACTEMLHRDPWKFLASLKPRGGLFGGETAPSGPLTNAWLLLGIYVLAGVAFSAICAHRALNTGRPPILWFLAGLFFNAFGYLFLLTRPALGAAMAPARYAGVTKIPSTAEPLPCSECGATNHPSAARCPACGATLQPIRVSEVQRIRISSH